MLSLALQYSLSYLNKISQLYLADIFYIILTRKELQPSNPIKLLLVPIESIDKSLYLEINLKLSIKVIYAITVFA